MNDNFRKVFFIFIIVLQTASALADLQSEFRQAYSSYNQYLEVDDVPLALGAAADAHKLGSKLYGRNHINTAKLAINYASLLNDTEDYKKAAKTLKGKLEIMEKSYGEDANELVSPLTELGRAHLADRKPEKAIGYFQRASDILENHDNRILSGARNFDIVAILLKRRANQYTRPFVEASYSSYDGLLEENDIRWGLTNYHMAMWSLQDERLADAIDHLNMSLIAFKTSDDQITDMEKNLRLMLIDTLQRAGKSAVATEHCLAIGERENWVANPLYIKPPNLDLSKAKKPASIEIKLIFTVDEQGFVRKPRIKSSTEPDLNGEALAAVTEFRYAPKFINGSAVSTDDVSFTIAYEAPPQPKFTRPPMMGLKSAGDEKSGDMGSGLGGSGGFGGGKGSFGGK
ncbi:MAG: tetratricopeptide repeat protein [Candidatus Azotimanducaceae bacterium]|uniref:Tetratricopeptide repeat protein n=1 Tax=OM182 bacterium TaxID=2510334 RepID=A0A520S3B0_9GAMM|nr:hypothetical protein [Gammaproteobacteria bacterium]RZO76967.1 MAG: tetratricopeptide repeat protein [OM182 bacterium]